MKLKWNNGNLILQGSKIPSIKEFDSITDYIHFYQKLRKQQKQLQNAINCIHILLALLIAEHLFLAIL